MLSDCTRRRISLQHTRSPSIWKNGTRSLLEPNISALLLGNSKSLSPLGHFQLRSVVQKLMSDNNLGYMKLMVQALRFNFLPPHLTQFLMIPVLLRLVCLHHGGQDTKLMEYLHISLSFFFFFSPLMVAWQLAVRCRSSNQWHEK